MHEPSPRVRVPKFFKTSMWVWSFYNEPWDWNNVVEIVVPVPQERCMTYAVQMPQQQQLVAVQSWDLFDRGYRGITTLFVN